MFEGSFTAIVRRASGRRHALLIGVLLVIVFVLSVASVELRFPGSATAPWWPAAGFAALATLSSRGRGFAIAGLVVVVTTLANLVVGTIWWVALAFGLANAAEAWIVAAVLRVRRGASRPFGPGDLLRFFLATLAGGIVIGLVAGLAVELSGGVFAVTAPHVAASHASAVLVIAALGVLPRSAYTVGRPGMLAVQVVTLIAAVVIAFAPDQRLPLAFLPFPVLAWAAFRFGSGILIAETVLTGAAALGASLLGSSPFDVAAEGDPTVAVGLAQLYVASLIVSLLPLAVVQDGQAALFARLSAREQLLRGVVVNAHAGFLVVRRHDGRLRVVESNPTGMRLLGPWVRDPGDGPTLDDDALGIALPTGTGETWRGEHGTDDGILRELAVTPVAGQRELFLVEAVDATEQRAASRALSEALVHEREALERLRELAAQKDRFVASVSHELRTPVTNILGYAEQLADDDSVERRSVDVILRNARRLAELVDDLLSLSQASAGFTPVAVDIARVFAGCETELSAIARTAGVTLEIRMPDQLAVAGDPRWVERVLINLTTNALKFTPAGGSVVVGASATNRATVRISVTDSGRGIAPERLEEVFERFTRIADPDRGFVAGAGLGLPIARDLVTRMGGTVVLHSDGEHGTEAVVELPAATIPVPGAA